MKLPGKGLQWLMRPVLRNLCKMESLKDGTLDLCDVALMNDALSVEDENNARAHAAAAKKRR